MPKTRLDQLLVARGLAESRSKAAALIMAGLVYSGEKKLDKAGAEFPEDIELNVRGKEHPWVSRGGMKLAHALSHFGLDVNGVIAIDIGASTGGFTDVLLTNGATKVYAVDVGHGQLDAKLRADPRVVVMEHTNARHFTADMFIGQGDAGAPLPAGEAGLLPHQFSLHGNSTEAHTSQRTGGVSNPGEGGYTLAPPRPHPDLQPIASRSDWANPTSPAGRGAPVAMFFDLITCDASFISLKKVLPAALALAKPDARLIALIKPQFEVGKKEVSKGEGVIRDPKLHQEVCEDIRAWITEQGWQVVGITPSPITGPKGNVEFLLVAVK